MISHKYKCIYIHIPKCGGTSVESAFMKDIKLKHRRDTQCYERLHINPDFEDAPEFMKTSHLLLSEYPKFLVSQYFTFTIIRHPIDRAVSFYRWLAHEKYENFTEFCHSLFSQNSWTFMMTRPQVDYIEGGVDHIMKIGKYDGFFMERFGFNVGHINISPQFPVDVSEEAKSILLDKYKSDFDLWNSIS
jgi:hypothetical protein